MFIMFGGRLLLFLLSFIFLLRMQKLNLIIIWLQENRVLQVRSHIHRCLIFHRVITLHIVHVFVAIEVAVGFEDQELSTEKTLFRLEW